ncbi:hypothetical protein PM082_002918 [Marasmius tenuissimus]|nr:hypothetical protein PM082_002918 [Marasmius tenuissimus]
MAKKKKTQLKPVARGFATTSVPKKVIEAEEEPAEEIAVTTGSDKPSEIEATVSKVSSGIASQAPPPDEFDPDKVEEQSLQNLVDKLQEKTEKEINRTVKAIEVDRRFAQSLPTLDLNSTFVTRILELHSEFDNAEPKQLDEPEDKAVARLAITYGVLRRLGFTEERVEECLKAIDGVELEDAYNWLYLNCPAPELTRPYWEEEDRTPGTPMTPTESTGSFPKTPKTPRTPADFLAPSPAPTTPSRKNRSRLNANAPSFVPSNSSNAPPVPPINSSSPLPNEGPVYDDNELNDQYIRTKLEIAKRTTHRSATLKSSQQELSELRSRLLSITQEYVFDEREAEALYQKALQQLEADLLRDRLLGKAPPEPPEPVKSTKRRPPSIDIPAPATDDSPSSADVFNQTEDSGPGLLDLLEDLPTSEATAGGRSWTIRDMALPKHWSGRTPKLLLQETVRKADKFAVISFTIVSGGNRAKRAAVRVRWQGKKLDEWIMEDVACPEENQAEQYIATIALHALTYPRTEGFAAGNPGASNSHTFFRLLPPKFRDLWDELGEALKTKNDEINRRIWGNLRSIVEPKINLNGKSNGKFSKPGNEVNRSRSNRGAVPISDFHAEQLKASFQSRQALPAYQEMLQTRNKLPIAQYRDEIINILEESQVLVLSGETGCGKSTQVPTFILEDQLSKGKPCKVYCTEPRRISAISLAQRVSRELGEPANVVGTGNSLVGYSIRLESNTTKNTRLAFVTNGIALRMLEGGSGHGGQGTAFDEITHIVIDEVHERTIESDFLLIVLKSLLEQRADLK